MEDSKSSMHQYEDSSTSRIKGIAEASLWQYFTFGWNTNLIWNYGRFEGKITPQILPELSQADDSGYLSDLINAQWEVQLSTGSPSLAKALFAVFKKEFLLIGVCGLVESFFKILQAGVLGFFIRYLRDSSRSVQEGCLLALALSACVLFSSVFQHHFFFPATRLAYKARVGLIAFLFRKTLSVSSSSMLSTGEAINIISNDVQPFENGIPFLYHLILGPFEIILAIVFLWLNIGISCFVAIGVYLLMIPLQSCISHLFGKIRAATVTFRDDRVKLLTDILSGIEIVKLNAWEIPLLTRIFDLRKKEHDSLKRAVTLKGINQSLFGISSQIVYFFSFTTLWFLTVKGLGLNLGNSGAFQPENIFPCVSIFATLRLTMTLFIPSAFQSFAEIKVSISRIEKLLNLPSFKPILYSDNADLSIPDENNNNPSVNPPAILFENASFSWKSSPSPISTPIISSPKKLKSVSNLQYSSDTEKSIKSSDLDRTVKPINSDGSLAIKPTIILSNISLSIKSGELCGVLGPVGCGKSSFCNAILGEMHKVDGSLIVNLPNFIHQKQSSNNASTHRNSPVAYASQSPWIFGGTIRDNILFGNPYDETWFNTVISACSLDRDLSLLDNREFTLIGERGATLSGGQKARVALARAVYTRADLYILDDPLSAVDPKVGRHLFDNVIKGLLRGKTIVLVTHQLQFIHGCDTAVVLQDGCVVEHGSPYSITQLDKYNIVDENQESENFKSPIELDISEDVEDIYQNPVVSLAPDLDLAFSHNFDPNTDPLVPRNSMHSSTGVNNRKKSKSSFGKSRDLKQDGDEFKMGNKETMNKSNINLKIFLKFFSFGPNYIHYLLALVLAILMQGVAIYADYYLSVWSSLPIEMKSKNEKVLVYFILVVCSIALSMLCCVLLFRMLLASSNGLLLGMLDSVIKAPMSFFQSQPLGRVLNRFSKDQSNTDELLAQTTIDTLFISIQTIGILVIVSISNIYLLISIPFILAIFFWLRTIYMKTSRQVKRIESVSRSPVYSLLSETLDGMITIRSYDAQDGFLTEFIETQNANSRAFFAFLGAGRWLAFRLDLVNTCFAIISAFSMVGVRNKISPNLVALSMSYILSLVGMVQWGIRQSIEAEIIFISVERNIAYTEIKPEESPEISNSPDEIPDSWPEEGNVEIRDLSLLYPFSESPVLKHITMSIKAGEKIGIVGRTGAGKSSLVSSIFRLFEPYPNGCVEVDGVNISNIRLGKLRPSFSMIPQQPFLFEGSLRFNLDPWSEYSDEQIWNALESSSLKRKIEEIPEKLEYQVVENGKNFSVGERQLISLCRAILQNKKLVVMDEATANVDLETDKKIQQSIHTFFEKSTVITIAHRLNTVIGNGYDKIAVLDHGVLKEFGSAHELLQNPESLLSLMVANTGKETESNLRQLAFEQFSSVKEKN
ncbi:Multidrug resistance-associated protein 4 [Smittium mucronatum]|uniref:Multidrug resistance-associated protein 4 n=1 Tax=Smittium mucronatum TaxID=133383 RepID=A0A1R0H2D9_9FUNG|nr:Multidrug resistance-associated protein 4 [Smittium mucronatum]